MHTLVWTTNSPLDLAASLARYTRWGADPVNVVVADAYHRVTPAGTAYRAAARDARQVDVTVAHGSPEDAQADLAHRLAEHVPRPTPAAKANDTVGSQWRRMRGYRPPMVADPFEAVVTAITAQQVNLTWATTTRRRLVEAFGGLHPIDDVPVWSFPTPEVVAGVAVSKLREMQFTTSKSEYIIGVAEAAANGYFDGLAELDDQEAIEHVTNLRGVGRWTADWLLARCLGRGHIVAAGDLGVRKAVSRWVLHREDLASEDEVRDAVSGWGPGTNWSTHLLLEKLAA